MSDHVSLRVLVGVVVGAVGWSRTGLKRVRRIRPGRERLRGFGVGARLGLGLPANFEIEGQFDLTLPRNSTAGNRFRLRYPAASALYNVPVGQGSAYLRAGYGLLKPSQCLIFGQRCSSHGAAAGALGFRVPAPSLPVQIRAEAMYRFRKAYDYKSFGFSIGLTYLTGKRRGGNPSAGPDADRDGVPNRRDRCPNTPLGAMTDSTGCPTDFDGDGVFDGIDRCPTTPPGTQVDRFGCPASRPD